MARGFWTALADTLIPGDGAFPSASASAADCVDLFEARLRQQWGDAALDALHGVLSVEAPFAALDEPGRIAAVTGLAGAQHARFEEMLAVLYLSYYEREEVTAAIRDTGLVYHNPPQPTGYGMTAFDPEDALEFPRHARGRYVPTDEVRRVELAGLAHLAAPIDRP